MNEVKIARKLNAAYNPRYKNKELLKDYNIITGESVNSQEDIRKKYNDIILKDYHNEAVIKYHLTNYLMKKVSNCSIMYEVNTNINLNENSRMSRCDMVYAYKSDNFRTTTAYEIKTEFDTFHRLPQQIEDYEKIFNFVIVVIPESKEDELHNLMISIKKDFGIMTYDKDFNFTLRIDCGGKYLIYPPYQINCMTRQFIKKKFSNKLSSREELIQERLLPTDINNLYVDYLHDKYGKNWENLKKQIESKTIYPLDYQWFFKNTVDTSLVYNR